MRSGTTRKARAESGRQTHAHPAVRRVDKIIRRASAGRKEADAARTRDQQSCARARGSRSSPGKELTWLLRQG